jgi:GAF domain-containing protein/anti-sigma regulatory factor (Ser/Thr protein kinase)
VTSDRLTGRASRSWQRRYGLALLATVAGFVATGALLAFDSVPNYAPMAGAVLLSAWFGGIGPAGASLAIGGALGLWTFVEPRGELDLSNTDDVVRWATNLGVAALIVVAAAALRLGRQRASQAAQEAESSLGHVEALQQLSAELAVAASSAEISHALAERAAALLDAQGSTLGLLDNDVLAVEPIGLAESFRVPERRLLADRKTVLTAAVREGKLVRADDRRTLEHEFPDSAAILPAVVQSVLAVPLRLHGSSVGVVEFLFDRPNAIDDELASVASTAASLAGQALERSRLYEREREARMALDRILEVAPRFYADREEEVTTVICREARTTFGADYGVLWRIFDGELELVCSDPTREEWPAGLRVPLVDYPGLDEAVASHSVSFVPDVLLEARGDGLERARQLGIRSSLRSPIVIGGRTELVLAASWQTVVDQPDPATYAIVRRYADQAGLALEQLERRRAEQAAAARAEETARLQEVTAQLSSAATGPDVGDTCLKHALQFVGAEAGFIVLTGAGGTSVQMLSSEGYTDDVLEAWGALGLDAAVPFAHAISTGEPVWALTRDEMSAFTAVPSLDDAGWISIPLKTPAGIQGALHVSLREERDLGGGERRWLQTVVSQCALALERSKLYDEEQGLRERAERLQRTTERLSNAATQVEVADAVVESAIEGVGAASAVLYSVNDEPHVARPLVVHVDGSEAGMDVDVPLEGDSPVAQALRHSAWWQDPGAASDGAPPAAGSSLIVPLVAGRRSVGALELGWDEPFALDRDERIFLQTLANQAAAALERARHFESERSIAETLQRSVLPVSLPRVPGVQIAARYMPGTKEVAVGGDWFDALELAEDRVGLVVGDVVGKGVHAAASMGQLRNALRAIALERLKPPSALARLDRLASETLETSFATLVYAVVDTSTGVLRFSSAGHPPPVVAYSDGRVELLEDGRGLPLGTGLAPKYRQSVVELPAGSIVVLYSDGLVERRGRTIDDGIAALVEAVGSAPKDAERLLEHVLGRLSSGSERPDDVVILAARILPVAPKPLDLITPSEPDSLHLVRDAIRTWLEGTELSRTEREDLLLAAWEICANAIEHASEPREGTIRVRASIDDSHARLVVDDSGRFVQVTERPDRGLGLRLAEELSSALEVTMTEAGTTVALEKTLPEGDEPVRRSR